MDEIIDIRFLPKERNDQVFRVLIKMLIDRGLISESEFENMLKTLTHSFDQVTQTTEYDQNDLKLKVKFVMDKISTLNKINGLLSFIENNQDIMTFILVDDIYQRPFKEIMEYPKTEVFWIKEFFQNPRGHQLLSPKMRPLNATEKQAFLDEYDVKLKDIPKMENIDPDARYFNLKCGDIVEIIRPSNASGEAIGYRVVVKCNYEKLFAK